MVVRSTTVCDLCRQTDGAMAQGTLTLHGRQRKVHVCEFCEADMADSAGGPRPRRTAAERIALSLEGTPPTQG